MIGKNNKIRKTNKSVEEIIPKELRTLMLDVKTAQTFGKDNY